MAPPRAWRLLGGDVAAPADGPTNMAVDAALLAAVRAGAWPLFRFYRWSPPTLSFGRNQPAAGLYDEAAARARGIGFVRRPTGGQAVLHADELTYAVVAPVEVIGRPREAYRTINEALVAGLRRLGVEAEVLGARVAGPGTAVSISRAGVAHMHTHTHPGILDWSAACFRDPAEGEVVVAGRKLVGSAQRCEGRVVLQHGSILISGSQAAAEELLLDRREAGGRPASRVDAGWTTLEEALGERPSWDALVRALVTGVEETLGTALAPGGLSIEERARARQLRATYASRDWTWRR